MICWLPLEWSTGPSCARPKLPLKITAPRQTLRARDFGGAAASLPAEQSSRQRQAVIEREFEAAEGAEAVGFSHSAINPPHRIKQKNQKSPERNKFETALRELIVSGGGLVADVRGDSFDAHRHSVEHSGQLPADNR